MDWDPVKYRNASEPTAHWELKRDFMQSIKHMFDEERVACLAQVLGNIQFMGCSYPHDVMVQVQELAKDVLEAHKERLGNKLQRTLVSGSSAANDKVNKTNASVKRPANDDNNEESSSTSRPAKFHKYGNFVSSSTPTDDASVSEKSNEGYILPPVKSNRPSSCNESMSTNPLYGSKQRNQFEIPETDEIEELPPSIQKANKFSKNRQQLNVKRILPFNYDFPACYFIIVNLEYLPDDQSFCILQRSASFCRIPVSFKYQSNSNVFEVTIGNYQISEETGDNESDARQRACDMAIDILSENCYKISIKNKYTSDGTEVDIVDVQDNTKVGKNKEKLGGANVGHKLLSMMGWSGGGLGKDGSGIAEPITAESVFGRQGMGYQESDLDVGKVFKKKIEAIIKEYIGTSGCHDLVFTTGFDNAQRAEMHKIARRFGLKSKSFGKGDDRHLTISKKFDPKSLIEELLHNDGETEKYILKPPNNLKEKFNRIIRFE